MTPHKQYFVAIIGSTTLKGEEIKASLEERSFPIRDIKLLDEIKEESDAILTSFRDEARVIMQIQEDSFKGVDIAFFCCRPSSVRHYLSLPAVQNILSFDLSLSVEPGLDTPVIVHGVNDPEYHEGKGVVACPCPLTVPIALLLKSLVSLYEVGYAAATALEPASEYGKAGLEALHRETTEIISFSDKTGSVFRHQQAFNLIPLFSEEEKNKFSPREARIRREMSEVLAPASVPFSIAVIQAPTFHGHAISLFVRLNEDAEEEEVMSDLERAGIPVGRGAMTPVEAVGKSDFFLSHVRKEPDQAGCFWFWIVCDNLKRAGAANAVMAAESIINRI